jgi:putative ABC transport system permease protein
MHGLLRHVRFALRALRRNPGFSAVAILTMALGIGATAAIFSVIHGVLLRPLSFADPDRVAMVWLDNHQIGVRTDITSYPYYREWRDGSHRFADMAAYARAARNVTGDGEAERVRGAAVTANFFDVMGVVPLHGRGFVADEEYPGADASVVLSHQLWQRRYAGDAGVIGQTIQLNDRDHAVVGVMSAGFRFPDEADFWLPLAPSEALRDNAGAFWLYVVGRLAPGASVAAAQTEMAGVNARLAEAYPDQTAFGIYVQPVREHLFGDVRSPLLLLLGAVGFVLLIGCANVANLLLARAAAREREMALRTALGASRGAILRQLLVESSVLAVLGGAVGLALAYTGVKVFQAIAPTDIPRLADVAVDGTVLAFALAVSVLTGLLFGLAPATQAARGGGQALRDGARGVAGARSGRRTRSVLIAGEVALALVLLVGAGLLARSLATLNAIDMGFAEPHRVLTADLTPAGEEFRDPARVLAFYDEVLDRLAGLPGVEVAAASSSILLPALANSGWFTIEGRPVQRVEERIEVTIDAVTPGYFQAVGTPLVRGRGFSPSDAAEAPLVAIINESMAREFWPGEDPIGQRYKYGSEASESPWRTVVGVAADARRTSPVREARPSTFLPHAQVTYTGMTLALRAEGRPIDLAPAVRREVRAVSPNVPVTRIATLDSMLGERLAGQRLTTLLAGGFSALALVLALIGIYGVVAYTVSQETRQIGVRLALGARAGSVVRLLLRQILVVVAAGATIGLAAALVLTRAMSGWLHGIASTDALTFAAVVLAIVVTAAVAAWIPARRAARVDPMVALREE